MQGTTMAIKCLSRHPLEEPWEVGLEGLAIADAASQELWPLRHAWERISGFGQETPELWMMPAEVMASAVPVLADSLPQTPHLKDELVARKGLKISVRWCHTSSVDGSQAGSKDF